MANLLRLVAWLRFGKVEEKVRVNTQQRAVASLRLFYGTSNSPSLPMTGSILIYSKKSQTSIRQPLIAKLPHRP